MEKTGQRWQTRLNAFEDLTAKWRDVGLTALQRSPDAAEVASNKDLVLQGRRLVGAKTKEFARFEPEVKVAEVGGLIRSYQEYIDTMSKCLGFAEKAFLDLHASVLKMVDPFPMMDKFSREKQTILNFIKASDERDELRINIGEYENELQGLKNQEVTIEQLRSQLAAAEMGATSRVEQSAIDASAEVNVVLRQWQERENVVRKELAAASAGSNRLLVANRDLNAQLVALRAVLDDAELQREQTVDALVSELDESHTRIILLEKQIARNISSAAAAGTPQRSTTHATPDTPAATPVAPAAAASSEGETAKRAAAALSAQLADSASELVTVKAAFAVRESELLSSIAASAESRKADQLQSDELRFAVGSLSQTVDVLKQDVASQRMYARQLEQERSALQEGIQRAESELTRREARAAVVVPEFSIETVMPPASSTRGATSGGGDVTVHAPSESAVADDFYAVAAQRDKLRQRLLSLEEVSSAQTHALKIDVSRLEEECGRLRSVVQQQRTQLMMSSTEIGNSDDEVEHRSLAELSRLSDKRVATREIVIRVLDQGMAVLSKSVLANLQLRRLFLAYLIGLHTIVFLVVLKFFMFR